ncbi:MAG: hypothetical protein IJ489_05630 [Clostridia bacterium]|nr:hypothetical protein [Clostridia bacterium]
MTELEKIEYAKMFIDKLANGINPLDDTQVPENDIVNNVRLSRCFFYVSDILRQVIENGGTSVEKTVKHRKKEFSLTEDARAKIQVSESPLSVSEISKGLNDVIDSDTMKTISPVTINDWLVDLGLLEVIALPNGENKKMPTQRGNQMGIFTEERTGIRGKYIAVLFSSQAQQFIYDNIEAVVETKNGKKRNS